ncbi:MAG: DNA polymerase III subunit gamma/tau [Candidatus Shapirobacteria bacterium]|nr:DNA polymerase III subunit gamma/tau [Candidatus Shapirobacteria bacterium]
MAFYLKYRPKRIADIDLAEAREVLTKALGSNSFPHAVLLAGPKGIGKTSAARIIAKRLNCLSKKIGQVDPCNHCSSCLAIDRGAFLDVLEIDAASNRGIDDIRQLKEGVGLAPVKGRQKIYIIDEVHMLTSEAFNALLKTLEEPPEKVVFLLCTTNPEKIPQTVLSRCLRINFHKASHEEVLRSLKRVVENENLIIENDQVLTIIAQNVDGSFRDGQKILEELSFSKNKITVEDASNIVGRQVTLEPSRLLDLLSKNNLSLALEEISFLEESGVDWLLYIKILLDNLRNLLHGVWGLADGQKSGFSQDQLIWWAEIFSQTAEKIKNSPLPVLTMELAIGQLINTGERNSNSDKEVEEEKKVPKRKGQSSNLKKINQRSTVKKLKIKDERDEDSSIFNKKKAQKSENNQVLTEEQWQILLKKVRPQNHSLEAFLKAAYPISLEDNRLTLGVYYQFHKECLEKEVNRRIIEKVAGEILNFKVSLFYRLSKKPSKETRKNFNKSPVDSADNNLYSVAKEIFGGDNDD